MMKKISVLFLSLMLLQQPVIAEVKMERIAAGGVAGIGILALTISAIVHHNHVKAVEKFLHDNPEFENSDVHHKLESRKTKSRLSLYGSSILTALAAGSLGFGLAYDRFFDEEKIVGRLKKSTAKKYPNYEVVHAPVESGKKVLPDYYFRPYKGNENVQAFFSLKGLDVTVEKFLKILKMNSKEVEKQLREKRLEVKKMTNNKAFLVAAKIIKLIAVKIKKNEELTSLEELLACLVYYYKAPKVLEPFSQEELKNVDKIREQAYKYVNMTTPGFSGSTAFFTSDDGPFFIVYSDTGMQNFSNVFYKISRNDFKRYCEAAYWYLQITKERMGPYKKTTLDSSKLLSSTGSKERKVYQTVLRVAYSLTAQKEKELSSSKSNRAVFSEFEDKFPKFKNEEYILLYKAFEYAHEAAQELESKKIDLYPSVRAQHDVYQKNPAVFANSFKN